MELNKFPLIVVIIDLNSTKVYASLIELQVGTCSLTKYEQMLFGYTMNITM